MSKGFLYTRPQLKANLRWLLIFSITALAGFSILVFQEYTNHGSLSNGGWYIALAWIVFAFLLVLLSYLRINKDMVLRQKAEDELVQSEMQYRSLIENVGAVIYTTDVFGNITFANKYANQLTGYSAEEMIGRHFTALLDPKDVDRITAYYFNQLQQRIPTTILEFEIIHRSGQKKWVSQLVQLIYEEEKLVGFQCLIKDVDKQVRMQLELNTSEQRRKENQYRLEAIIENTTSLVFIKDLEGRYIMANRRFKEVMGFTDEMMIGKTDHALSPKHLADHYKQLDDEAIRTGKPVESEELIEGPHGPMSLLLVKVPLRDADNKIFGVSGIATDITERVHQQEQLIVARKDAEEAKKMQELFLANMSHEIRTPMNGINGMTDLLLDTDLSVQQREFADIIKRSANSLLVLVNDLLDFSKIKAGKLSVERTRFSIDESLKTVEGLFAQQINSSNLRFIIKADPAIPPVLLGDPYRLNQVLVNLVGNAIKFTKEGSVTLEATLRKKNGEKAEVQFTVTDTGIGIETEKLDKVFESFSQANSDTTRRYGGTGLGLAICKDLVELQHGYIMVKSQPGKGSEFSFYIPYGYTTEIKTKLVKNDPVTVLRNKHFLVAEDNEVNQKLIGHVLAKVDAVATIVSNGKEAIEKLQEPGVKYDLVIMDVQMPVMDGYQATAYIRQQLKMDIPVIAMTAAVLKSDQDKCFEAGVNDLMLKPFDFNDLYKRIIRLLYGAPAQQTALTQPPAMTETKMYDLKLLEDLDDKEALLDVLTLFLRDSSVQTKELVSLAKEQQWESVSRLAHKLKGATSMLQATELATLLTKIEKATKTGEDRSMVTGWIHEAEILFNKLETQLERETETIRKEIAVTAGK